ADAGRKPGPGSRVMAGAVATGMGTRTGARPAKMLRDGPPHRWPRPPGADIATLDTRRCRAVPVGDAGCLIPNPPAPPATGPAPPRRRYRRAGCAAPARFG